MAFSSEQIASFSESPTEDQWLSWGLDGTARLWDVANGPELWSHTHTPGIGGAVFDADGRRVLSWGAGHGGCGMRPPVLNRRQNHKGGVRGAVFAADGRVLSWGADGRALLGCHERQRRLAHSAHDATVLGASFAPDGEHVLSWDQAAHFGTERRECGRLPPASGSRSKSTLEKYPTRSLPPTGDGCCRGGRQGLSGFGTRRPGASSRNIPTARTFSARFAVSVLGDERRVLSWSFDGTVRVWDAATGAALGSQRHGDSVAFANAVFIDDRRVLSSATDGTARVWDATSGAELARQTHRCVGRGGAVLAPDRQRVLSWGLGWNRAFVMQNGTNWLTRFTLLMFWTPSSIPMGDACCHGMLPAACGCGMQPAVPSSRDKHTTEALAAPSSLAMVSGCSPGRPMVASVCGRRVRKSRHVHDADVEGAVFFRDERRVLSWSGKTATVWDATTGIEIGSLTHDAAVTGAVFSGDGESLAWVASRSGLGYQEHHKAREPQILWRCEGRCLFS